MEKDILWKWLPRENWRAILIPKKLEFQFRKITRDKEGNYILIKCLIQQENIVSIYTDLTTKTRNILWKKQKKELKGELDSCIIIVGDFNTPISIIYRTIRQNIK